MCKPNETFAEMKLRIAAQNIETLKKAHNSETCKIKGTDKCLKTCAPEIVQAVPLHLNTMSLIVQ